MYSNIIPYMSEAQLSRYVTFPLRIAPVVGKVQHTHWGGLYGRTLPTARPFGVPVGPVRRFPHAPRPYPPFVRRPWQVVRL